MAHWSHYRNSRLTRLVAVAWNLSYMEAANLLETHRDGEQWARSEAANRIIAIKGGTGPAIEEALIWRHDYSLS